MDHLEMIDLLSHYSKNIWNLAFRGCVTRLAEVLKAEPQLAKSVDKDGITPLWWLLDDEAKALDIVDLFLSHGTDPSLKNQEAERPPTGPQRAACWKSRKYCGKPRVNKQSAGSRWQ